MEKLYKYYDNVIQPNYDKLLHVSLSYFLHTAIFGFLYFTLYEKAYFVSFLLTLILGAIKEGVDYIRTGFLDMEDMFMNLVGVTLSTILIKLFLGM